MSDPTRVKADLVRYTAEYSKVVRSWIDTEETYQAVCRGINFPPKDDIVDSWQREGVHAYLLFSENKPVAYAELWDKPAEQAMEVCHLIVDTYRRGKGFGTKMVELLFSRAASRPSVAQVQANLYGQTNEVLGTLMKAGFELVGASTHVEGLRMMRLVKR